MSPSQWWWRGCVLSPIIYCPWKKKPGESPTLWNCFWWGPRDFVGDNNVPREVFGFKSMYPGIFLGSFLHNSCSSSPFLAKWWRGGAGRKVKRRDLSPNSNRVCSVFLFCFPVPRKCFAWKVKWVLGWCLPTWTPVALLLAAPGCSLTRNLLSKNPPGSVALSPLQLLPASGLRLTELSGPCRWLTGGVSRPRKRMKPHQRAGRSFCLANGWA